MIEEYIIYIILVLLVVGGIVIYIVPSQITKSITPLSTKIELTNKIRTTFSQVLGGLVLVGTLWANIHDTRVTRKNFMDQIKEQDTIAKEDRKLTRELAEKNDTLLNQQLKNQVDIATKDRGLAMKDLNQRAKQLDETLKQSNEDRKVLIRQIQAQRESSFIQKHVQLYSQAIELLASEDIIKQFSGIETLYDLANADSAYFKLSEQIFLRTLKAGAIKGEAKSLMFERLVTLTSAKGHKSRVFYGLDLSNIDVEDISLDLYHIKKCNLNNAKIAGSLLYANFEECQIKSTLITSSNGNFKMNGCYRRDTTKMVKYDLPRGLDTPSYLEVVAWDTKGLEDFVVNNKLYTIENEMKEPSIIDFVTDGYFHGYNEFIISNTFGKLMQTPQSVLKSKRTAEVEPPQLNNKEDRILKEILRSKNKVVPLAFLLRYDKDSLLVDHPSYKDVVLSHDFIYKGS